MPKKCRKDRVWDKAKKIRGKDPKLYRKDPYGNVMYYRSYGKNTIMGWEEDHIKPKKHGGSDSVRNLQAINTKTNRQKADSRKKRSRHSKCNK
ncbi:MAG: HNH endonuclease [Candidatus Aegiribacteria sp.]|nr:HNH endonuclease [Candidatus Aegiribacteria sp.]